MISSPRSSARGSTLLQGLVVLTIFLLTSVVAAGVFMVLGPLVPRDNDTVAIVGMVLVGALAVACSILFLLGALRHIPRWLSALPRKP